MRLRTFVAVSMVAGAGFGGLIACGDSDPTGTGIPEETTFDAALGVDLSQMTRLDGGLYVQDLVVGTGDEAALGDSIVVAYSGWTSSGMLFDRRTSAQGGVKFLLVQGGLIEGWVRGIPGLRVGGVRKLVIPAAMGYGSRGQGAIPPNAVLVFDVELLSIPFSP